MIVIDKPLNAINDRIGVTMKLRIALAALLGLMSLLPLPAGAQARAAKPAAVRARPADPLVESADERAKRYANLFRERLEADARLLEKLCELPPEGKRALNEQSDVLLRSFNEELIRSLTSSGPEGEKALVFGGQPLMVPRAFRLPRVFQRETLREILAQAISAEAPDAMAKLTAEQRRLDERHRRADVLTRVASLDAAVLLNSEQRDELIKLFTPNWKSSWRRPLASNPLFNSAIRSPAAVIAPFGFAPAPKTANQVVTDGPVDIAQILRPSQQAWWQALQQPVKQRQEVVIVRRPGRRAVAAVPKQRAQRQAAPQPAAPQPPAPVRDQRLAGAMIAVDAQAANAHQMVVRRAATSEAEESRLQALLERLVDDIDLTCGLTDEQRQKLLLAGKLDIHRQREGQQQVAAAGQPQPGDVVQVVRIAAALPMPSMEMFTDAESRYQKFLRGRLSDEQSGKLRAAERSRDEFRWLAVRETLLAALVDARLTADQCDELSRRLDEWWAARQPQTDTSAADLLRAACKAVRPWLPPTVDAWQLPTALGALKGLALFGAVPATP
jgi:hypothetical protein